MKYYTARKYCCKTCIHSSDLSQSEFYCKAPSLNSNLLLSKVDGKVYWWKGGTLKLSGISNCDEYENKYDKNFNRK